MSELSKQINLAAGTTSTMDVAAKVSQSLESDTPGSSMSITDIVKVGNDATKMIAETPNSAINSKMVYDALNSGSDGETFKPSNSG